MKGFRNPNILSGRRSTDHDLSLDIVEKPPLIVFIYLLTESHHMHRLAGPKCLWGPRATAQRVCALRRSSDRPCSDKAGGDLANVDWTATAAEDDVAWRHESDDVEIQHTTAEITWRDVTYDSLGWDLLSVSTVTPYWQSAATVSHCRPRGNSNLRCVCSASDDRWNADRIRRQVPGQSRDFDFVHRC